MGHSRNTHRKPKHAAAKRVLASTAVTGIVGTSLTVATAGTADGASVSVWDRVAECESGNNWKINTGNGYYGGLQFSASTWSAYGGGAYATTADLATKTQQILIAEKVLAAQGPGAWPTCSVKAGLTRGGGAPFSAKMAPKAVPVAPKSAPAKPKAGTATRAVSFARSKIGSPYLWGGNGPRAYDCSGLTSAAWRAAGINIPRTADAQWKNLPRVSMHSLKPGDLVAFGYSHSYADHIGMYVGGGMLIDTASRNPGGGVGIGKLSSRTGGGSWHALGAVRPQGSTQGAAVKKAPPVVTNEGVPDKPNAAPKSKPAAGTKAAPRTKRAPTTWGGKAYKVRAGDYLHRIAVAHNVKGGWQALYAANRSVVGGNPHLIFPDQVLTIPQ
ncbi:transglycosylase family protein [Streptomyces sp. NPDC088747]|uniref:transglycosylase family protein n=1 Tax=Streptomyces sp. NPDC088747 TaxID=3365886 RepID=UPI003815F964